MASPETRSIKVAQDDCLWKIVGKAGFPPKDWEKIYKAPYNAALRKKRPDPNVIHKGDIVVVPAYTPQDIVALTKGIRRAQDTLTRLEGVEDSLERAMADLERRGDTSAQERRLKVVKQRHKEMISLADDAAAVCSGMYDCIGAGLASQNFQNRANVLAREIKAIEATIRQRKAEIAPRIAAAKKTLAAFRKHRKGVAQDLAKLAAVWEKAKAKPY